MTEQAMRLQLKETQSELQRQREMTSAMTVNLIALLKVLKAKGLVNESEIAEEVSRIVKESVGAAAETVGNRPEQRRPVAGDFRVKR